MTQEEMKKLVEEASSNASAQTVKEIMPLFTQLIQQLVQAQSATPQPSKGKGKHYGKPSDYKPTEGQVAWCEYSDKTFAVWGDLADNEEAKKAIKAFGAASIEGKGYKATFMRSLPSLNGTPCGWLLLTQALEANGGMEALGEKLAECGLEVHEEMSVAHITAERKEQRRSERTQASTKPATPAPATPAPKAPAQTLLDINSVLNCHCLEVDREGKSENGYVECDHTLTKRGDFFTRKDETHTRIYLAVGTDTDSDATIYAEVGRVSGDYNGKRDALFNEASKDIAKAIADDKIKANKPIGWAMWMCGEKQNVLNAVFAKIA